MGRQLTRGISRDGENFDGQGTSEFQNLQSLGTGQATTGRQNDYWYYTSDFSSLQDALNAIGARDVLIHDQENTAFIDEAVTVDVVETLIGRGGGVSQTVVGEIEIVDRDARVQDIATSSDGTESGQLIVNGRRSVILRCDRSDIVVNSDRVGVYHTQRSTITFDSTTSQGVAIGNRDSTITDNGNNEVFANS